MPTVKVNDINMYYEIYGEGEPLVMIQGMGAEISMMGFENRKPGKYRWILFDNRGAGRTDKPDAPYTVEMMAEDTIGLMDAIGIKRAHVLGGSLGSRIALTVAAKHPERVNGLVLFEAAARSPHNDNPQLAAGFAQLREQIQMPGVAEKMGKYPPTARSFVGQFDAFVNFDGRSLLGDIRAPTLIAHCLKDTSLPRKYAEELAAGIAGARLIFIDDDHFFMVRRPELLFEPTYKFLEEVDGKATRNISKITS